MENHEAVCLKMQKHLGEAQQLREQLDAEREKVKQLEAALRSVRTVQ
jgi:hypothetical protein